MDCKIRTRLNFPASLGPQVSMAMTEIIYSVRHVVKYLEDNSRCDSEQYADGMYLESSGGE